VASSSSEEEKVGFREKRGGMEEIKVRVALVGPLTL